MKEGMHVKSSLRAHCNFCSNSRAVREELIAVNIRAGFTSSRAGSIIKPSVKGNCLTRRLAKER